MTMQRCVEIKVSYLPWTDFKPSRIKFYCGELNSRRIEATDTDIIEMAKIYFAQYGIEVVAFSVGEKTGTFLCSIELQNWGKILKFFKVVES